MRLFVLLAALALTAGCAWNAMYAADRSVADAQRATAAGDSAAALAAWRDALDAAAAAYRAQPAGGRADDALLVIAAARLALGQPAAAAAAARHLLATAPGSPTAGAARAWLGAALVRLDSASLGVAHLDTALAHPRLPPSTRALAVLHRAEGFLALGQLDVASVDVDAAAEYPATADAARLLAHRLAVATALREARRILDHATSVADVAGVPPLLDPYAGVPAPRLLVRQVGGLQQLALQARPGDMLPLFAAAELARDDLQAHSLAAALFLAFAAAAADTPWVGKAILAAHALRPGGETDALLEKHRANIYIRAAAGEAVEAELALAEERLARRLVGLRDAALGGGIREMTRP